MEGAAIPGSTLATVHHPGDVVIVDFWATHCPPCVKAFPRLQAIADGGGGRVHVVGVSEDDDAEVIPPFVTRTGVRFPMVWDKSKSVAERYGVASMPQTFVVDGKGVVRFVHYGYRAGEADELEREVQRLLAE